MGGISIIKFCMRRGKEGRRRRKRKKSRKVRKEKIKGWKGECCKNWFKKEKGEEEEVEVIGLKEKVQKVVDEGFG